MDIENQLLEALRKFNDRHEQCHSELIKEINISELKVKQFHYLEVIKQNKYLSFSQFATLLGVTKPSVTSIVNQLIKLDCVTKRQCTKDGRRFYVELSKKGEQIVAFKELQFERLVKKIVVSLTETEIDIFIRLINKIVNI